MKLFNVVSRGEVQDWEYMNALLVYAVNAVCASRELLDLTLLMQPSTPAKELKIFGELLFEEHRASSLLLGSTSLGALLEVGNQSGLVVDSGDTLTTCLAYAAGCPAPKTLFSLPLGGRDVTCELSKLLRLSGYNFDTSVMPPHLHRANWTL